MKKIKIIAATSFEIDEKTTAMLEAGNVLHYPSGLADLLISKGAASTCMSDPVKTHRVELGDINPAIFSEDGDMIRVYLTAPARVAWHTAGAKPGAGAFEGRDSWAAGLIYWFPRSVFKALERQGVAHRVSFAAKRVDVKIDRHATQIDLGWLPKPETRVEAGGFATVRAA